MSVILRDVLITDVVDRYHHHHRHHHERVQEFDRLLSLAAAPASLYTV